MKKSRGVLVVLAAVAGVCAAFCATASATVTTTNVNVPSGSPSFAGLDAGTVSSLPLNKPITVSGTTDGTTGDNVDIVCVFAVGTGNEQVIPMAQNVAVTGSHTFSTNAANGAATNGVPCRILALPHAATHSSPVDTTNFTGPDYYPSIGLRIAVGSGPNTGDVLLYQQTSATTGSVWVSTSLGGLSASAFDPSTLTGYPVISSLGIVHTGTATDTTINGQSLLFPAIAGSLGGAGSPGMQGITNIQSGAQPGAGSFLTSGSEPALACAPDDSTCTSLADSGVKLNEVAVGGGSGHTATVSESLLNTSSQTKQIQLVYRLAGPPSPAVPGWHFPGDPDGFSAHAANDVVTPPASGTGSIFIGQEAGSACNSIPDSCGALSWSSPPSAIRFTDANTVQLTYDRTLPAGCSAQLGLTGSLGHLPQSDITALAASAESSLASVPAGVSCPPSSAGQPPGAGLTPRTPPHSKKKCKKPRSRKSAAAAKKRCKKKRK
jgi:hypothetical protein